MKKNVVFVNLLIVSIFFFSFNNSFSQESIDDGLQYKNTQLQNEIINKRDMNSRHFKNPDGSFSAYIFPSPINYLKNNKWEVIECNIISNTTQLFSEYLYSNTKNFYKSFYSANAGEKGVLTQLDEGLIKEFISPEINSLKNGEILNTHSINNEKAIVAGSKLFYKNAYPSIDVRFTQTNTGRKLDYIINDRNAILSESKNCEEIAFSETIKIPVNWELIATSKEINIFDEKGKWIANYPEPIIYEKNASTYKPNIEEEHIISGKYKVEKNGRQYKIFTIVPLNWLLEKNRQFPIVVDPTVNYYPTNSAYWTGRQMNSTNKSNGYMRITNTSTTSWAKFNIANLAYATIKDVDFFSYHYINFSGSKLVKVNDMNNTDPVSANYSDIWNSITTNDSYITNYEWGGTSAGWRAKDLGTTADADIQARAISPGWTAVGFSYNSGITTFMTHYGYDNSVYKPYMRIKYNFYYNDLDIISLLSPNMAVLGNNTIKIKLKNDGIDSISPQNIYLRYRSNNSNWVKDTMHLTSIWNPKTTKDFTFSKPLFISVEDTYTICTKIYPQLANDPDNEDQLCVIKHSPMAGNYTIGSSGDYPSFNAAINALIDYTVDGPVTFSVYSGTYNERLVIPNNIVGVSSTNTVTFIGINKNNVKLIYPGINNSNRATLIFNGADYFTFKNMTIENTGTISAYGILFTNQANYNKISNCKINVNNTTNSMYVQAIVASVSESSTTYRGHNANYNTIENNEISGGFYGINMYGASWARCCNNEITGNTFTKQNGCSILMKYQDNTTINFNNINIRERDKLAIGIYTNSCKHSIIDANIIQPGRIGIRLDRENYYLSNDSTIVTNNIINNFHDTILQQGIFANNNCYYLEIYNNTIKVTGSKSNSILYSAICLNNTYNPVVKNNNLISTAGTMLISYSGNGYLIINGNNYYHPGSTTNMFYNNFVSYQNLATWKSSSTNIKMPHDVNSVENFDPHFLSATDLHLDSNYQMIRVKPLTLHDVDGDPRCPYEVSIGADESRYQELLPTALFYVDDTVCYSSPITLHNFSSQNSKAFKWYVNGVFKSNNIDYINTFSQGTHYDTVSLIATNCGGNDTFSKGIFVDTPLVAPISDFICSNNNLEVLETLKFYDLSSFCPSTWHWTISPDTINTPYGKFSTYSFIIPTNKNSQNPKIYFSYPGKYSVCLNTTNIRGSSSICKSDYIIVKPTQWMCFYSLPQIESSINGFLFDDGGPSDYQGSKNCSFKIDPCADTLFFTFTEFNTKPGDFLRVFDGVDNQGTKLWNTSKYGFNGISGSMASPGFDTVLTAPGGKLYFEWVTNVLGSSTGFVGEWSGVKKIVPKVSASIIAPDTVCANMPVVFTCQSNDDISYYKWKINGMLISINKIFVYTFSSTGTYNISLTLNNCGGDTTYYKSIVVKQPNQPPTADFTANILKPLVNQDVVTFIDLSSGCVDNWHWSISPSTYTVVSAFPNGHSPQIKFLDTICYNITLVAGYGSNYDTLTKQCFIKGIDYCTPSVQILNSDVGICRVTIGKINNYSLIGTKAYTDYSSFCSTILERKASYSIKVERNTFYNAIKHSVWIDWNIDGDFFDQGELVAYNLSSGARQWTDTFTVPDSVCLGATRMRIGVSLEKKVNEPCTNRFMGEVEDYRIFVSNDISPPKITLIGQDSVYFQQCTASYFDSGATAWDNTNKDMTANIITTNNLDLNNSGTYQYKYNVKDSSNNQANEAIRTIIITPDTTKPVITLKGNVHDTTEVLIPYYDSGYIVSDNCSGFDTVIISGNVDVSKMGTNLLKYVVYDKNGNISTIQRTVVVVDRTLPQISFIGNPIEYTEVYHPYNDKGINVFDNYCSNNITTISGIVDTLKVGKYYLKYEVTDCNGNGPVSLSRTVIVFDSICPQISSVYSDGDTIKLEVFETFNIDNFIITDNYDTNINISYSGSFISSFSDLVADIIGLYKMEIIATDQSANSTIFTLYINVVDTEKPVITLLGQHLCNICRFQYLDSAQLAIKVTDNYNKIFNIKKTGTYFSEYLVFSKIGLYSINFNVKDQSGNSATEKNIYVNVEDCPWSINEINKNNNIFIYPNPSTGEFIVKANFDNEKDLDIFITNSIGKTIRIIKQKNIRKGTFLIDLNNFSTGIYFVKFQINNKVVIKKISIIR
ncbi:MAG: DUF5011 domain-containing protein [Bacteroidota bacterium]|nr:DUF5011 domain-containing protein [Bacteroidota bacterium]